MHITQRQVTLGLQILLLVGLVLITISQIVTGTPSGDLLINFASILSVAVLFAAYLRGWAYAPKGLIVMGAILAALTPPAPMFGVNSVQSLLIPPTTALLLAGPAWIVGSAAGAFAIAALRPGDQALPDQPAFYIIYVMVVAWMVLARLVMDTALRDARANAHSAEHSFLAENRQPAAEPLSTEFQGV